MARELTDLFFVVVALAVVFNRGGGDDCRWAVQLYLMVLVLAVRLAICGRLG